MIKVTTLILVLCSVFSIQVHAQAASTAKDSLVPVTLATDSNYHMEYYIQIASLSGAFEKFPELDDLGTIFKIRHDSLDVFRYQLGTFETERLAKQYLLVVKNRGFKDAFVVKRAYLKED